LVALHPIPTFLFGCRAAWTAARAITDVVFSNDAEE
jgi:hypothetical protein